MDDLTGRILDKIVRLEQLFNTRFDRIEEKRDKDSALLHKNTETLILVTEDVKHHIKRTDELEGHTVLLQTNLELLKLDMDKSKKFRAMWGGAWMVLTTLGILAAIAEASFHIFTRT